MNLAMPVIVGTLMSLTMNTNDVHSSCLDRPGVVYRIAKQEGYSKNGSLPRRLNNPGSLVFAHQHHATRHHSGFAQFDTALAGWQALDRDISSKLRRHIKLHKGWKYL